jgi:hypothetical protein
MSVVQRLLVDEWRDGLSILSSVVTVVGFGVAIWQIRGTKSAADAARESALQMLAENRARFEDYSFGNQLQYLA